MAISPQVTNLAIILGMMQVSKKISMEDPDTQKLIRAGYILSNLIIISIYAFVHYRINKKKDLTTLKYIENPPLGSAEEPKVITTTNHAYDISQMKASYKAQLMGMGMMAVMHLYFKYTNPLLIQSIIPLKGALEGPEIAIHLFGKKPEGELNRPFKAPPGLLSSLQGGAAEAQDKKTIETAERSGRGGAKEENGQRQDSPLDADRNVCSPPTPAKTRRIEENRLKAKALRGQHVAASSQPASIHTPSGFLVASTSSSTGHKRKLSTPSGSPETRRDARQLAPGDGVQPARKFKKYIDHDFSTMKDTKGGFLSAEDDPWNKAMGHGRANEKPAHMTVKEWERHQLLKGLRSRLEGPFEPSIGLDAREKGKKCRECESLEINWQWEEVFKCAICAVCKEKFPEKYSLLTKTEAKDDYLLTDPELKDTELLPHLSKPNPLKPHWHDMMLFLRYQVEDYAFNTKWGSAEALDAEFEKREADKKAKKEKRFKTKLNELKKKTRTEVFRRNNLNKTGGGEFGDRIGNQGKHEHEWGLTVEKAGGVLVKTCVDCGMEVEELEF